jgi:hypothetical protein
VLSGNVRVVLLAASVPLFVATKAEKAFGFHVNRVYLTQAGAGKQTFPSANWILVSWVRTVRVSHFERSATQPRTRRL